MDDLEKFIWMSFTSEALDMFSDTREIVRAYDPDKLALVRGGFRMMIDKRSLSLREFANLNYLDFDNEDQLYDYLEQAYAYLFEGAHSPPVEPR